MMEKLDPNEDIRSLSQKLESITTTDPNLNRNDQQSGVNDPKFSTMPKFNNSPSMNSIQENRKKKSCLLDDNLLFMNDLPSTNLPEKIIFVVDTARELGCTKFETRSGGKFSPLYMIKRIIEIFVNAKSGIQQKHEYALMALKSHSASWICDFTNNHKYFLSNLENLEEEAIDEESSMYDLGLCFETICANTNFKENSLPDSVMRVILIYARSHNIPIFQTGRHFFDRLSEHSHFYLDSLYVHESSSDDNECQDIYEKLGALDTKQTSYILEVGRNAAALHTNMAKLIAHPLQRARQDDSPYTFQHLASTQDDKTNM